MRIVWLEDARNDLEDIYRFVAQNSERSAVGIHNEIYDRAGKLMTFPHLGKVDPLLNEDDSAVYRSLIVRRTYKIVYKVDNEIVYIIAIWDCRQNPEILPVKVKNK